jgi:hypothetical protein
VGERRRWSCKGRDDTTGVVGLAVVGKLHRGHARVHMAERRRTVLGRARRLYDLEEGFVRRTQKGNSTYMMCHQLYDHIHVRKDRVSGCRMADVQEVRAIDYAKVEERLYEERCTAHSQKCN